MIKQFIGIFPKFLRNQSLDLRIYFNKIKNQIKLNTTKEKMLFLIWKIAFYFHKMIKYGAKFSAENL